MKDGSVMQSAVVTRVTVIGLLDSTYVFETSPVSRNATGSSWSITKDVVTESLGGMGRVVVALRETGRVSISVESTWMDVASWHPTSSSLLLVDGCSVRAAGNMW